MPQRIQRSVVLLQSVLATTFTAAYAANGGKIDNANVQGRSVNTIQVILSLFQDMECFKAECFFQGLSERSVEYDFTPNELALSNRYDSSLSTVRNESGFGILHFCNLPRHYNILYIFHVAFARRTGSDCNPPLAQRFAFFSFS